MNRRDGLRLMAGLPALMALPQLQASDSPWSRGADMPFATQEIYPVAHQGELLVAGGIGKRAGLTVFEDQVVAYCPSTNRWRQHSTLPEARHHGALVVSGGRLFLMGGFNGGLTHIWRMRETVLEFTQDHWQPAVNLPQKLAEGVTGTAPNGRIHVVTGQTPLGEANKKRSDHSEIHAHWSWLPGERSWQEHAPIPTARNSATGAWVGDQLIVAGGRTASGNLDTVEIYSEPEDRWREVAPLPLPQAGTASVVSDEGLMVFGGEIFQPKAGVFEQVWRYSTEEDRWEAMPSLPMPRHGMGAVRFGDKVYVVGGARRPSGSGTSKKLEILDLTML